MLKKLFKYDFNSIKGIWCIIAVAVLAVALLGSISMRVTTEQIYSKDFNLIGMLGMLGGMLSALAVLASSTVISILIYYRFYKNLYSDEGYLTFTLPVKRSTVLMSKTLNAIAWQSLHIILTVVCIFIYVLIVPPTKGSELFNTELFSKIGELLPLLSDSVGWIILYAVAIIIFFASSSIFSVSLVQLAITIGAVVANKYKLVVGILIYYVVTGIVSFGAEIVSILITYLMVPGFVEHYADAMGDSAMNICILSLMVISAMATLIFGLVSYFITLDRIERKLNLA